MVLTPLEIGGIISAISTGLFALGSLFGGYAQRQKAKESDNEQEARVYNSIYERQNKILDSQAEELKKQIDRANNAELAYGQALLENAQQQGQLARLSHLELVVAELQTEIKSLRAERDEADLEMQKINLELIRVTRERNDYRDRYEELIRERDL